MLVQQFIQIHIKGDCTNPNQFGAQKNCSPNAAAYGTWSDFSRVVAGLIFQ